MVLREIQLSDLEFLTKIENDERYWFLSDTQQSYSKEQLVEYIQHANIDIVDAKQKRFVISIANGNTVGFIDLFDFNYLHSRAAVGIIVDEAFRSKGYGTKALELLCEYAGDVLKLNQLYADVFEDNTASKLLFEKLGFNRVGVKKHWIAVNGEFKDVIRYQKIFDV